MRKTYWTVSVQTYHADGSKGTSCFSDGDALADALAGAFREASYYIIGCGYDVKIELQEVCSTCHNAGTVRGKRGRKRCPVCKGVKPSGYVPPTDVALHPNVANAVAGGTV